MLVQLLSAEPSAYELDTCEPACVYLDRLRTSEVESRVVRFFAYERKSFAFAYSNKRNAVSRVIGKGTGLREKGQGKNSATGAFV
jgi:hypothetical protein